jgi:hypothetical protein
MEPWGGVCFFFSNIEIKTASASLGTIAKEMNLIWAKQGALLLLLHTLSNVRSHREVTGYCHEAVLVGLHWIRSASIVLARTHIDKGSVLLEHIHCQRLLDRSGIVLYYIVLYCRQGTTHHSLLFENGNTTSQRATYQQYLTNTLLPSH